METEIPHRAAGAIKATPVNGSGHFGTEAFTQSEIQTETFQDSGTQTEVITPGTEPEALDWFAQLAQPLLGKDHGYVLHLTTGFPESSCYSYTSGKRKVPGYLIRTLLRSDQGETWFNGIMDGCTAPWWLALQRDRRHAAAARGFVRSMESI